MSCNIQKICKRRDGRYRYWCLSHKANATGKYGVPLARCERVLVPPISDSEILQLKPEEYPGGIALWGAVPAVFDTTGFHSDRGIHVHARKEKGGQKEVDRTYRLVKVIHGNNSFEIHEEDAIYYMVAVVFGLNLKVVKCSHCGYSHLDKDVLSIKPHKKHLCSGCGRDFYDDEAGIGNPIMELKSILSDLTIQRATKMSDKVLEIKQDDFKGGVSIWGANQALLWTSDVLEEDGIHVHAFDANGNRVIDDTYGSVTIDGIQLDPTEVKLYMAQMAVPSLRGAIQSLTCPECLREHIDMGKYAITKHKVHVCSQCHAEFLSPGRKKLTISNPILDKLDSLEHKSQRDRAKPYVDLLPEGRPF